MKNETSNLLTKLKQKKMKTVYKKKGGHPC